jgi:hypothetical protein
MYTEPEREAKGMVGTLVILHVRYIEYILYKCTQNRKEKPRGWWSTLDILQVYGVHSGQMYTEPEREAKGMVEHIRYPSGIWSTFCTNVRRTEKRSQGDGGAHSLSFRYMEYILYKCTQNRKEKPRGWWSTYVILQVYGVHSVQMYTEPEREAKGMVGTSVILQVYGVHSVQMYTEPEREAKGMVGTLVILQVYGVHAVQMYTEPEREAKGMVEHIV